MVILTRSHAHGDVLTVSAWEVHVKGVEGEGVGGVGVGEEGRRGGEVDKWPLAKEVASVVCEDWRTQISQVRSHHRQPKPSYVYSRNEGCKDLLEKRCVMYSIEFHSIPM